MKVYLGLLTAFIINGAIASTISANDSSTMVPVNSVIPTDGAIASTITANDSSTMVPVNSVIPTDSLSKPIIKYNSLHHNTMHITCFSEYGPLPIQYELILGEKKVQEFTVHIKEPANFTILMTPGTNVQVLKCKARTNSSVQESIDIVLQSIEDDTPKGEDEEDDEDKDSGPKHLIALHHILTSVGPQVQKWNMLLLLVCGPTILFVLVIVIIVTYLRNRHEHRVKV